MVSVQPDGRVTGCSRYRAYGEGTEPEHLGAWRSALATDHLWRGPLHMALKSEIALARKRNVDYVEVGGWAISEDMRYTTEAINIALSTSRWRRPLGGASASRPPRPTARPAFCARLAAGRWDFPGARCPPISMPDTGARWNCSDSTRTRQTPSISPHR